MGEKFVSRAWLLLAVRLVYLCFALTVPEKFSACASDQAGLFFLDSESAQELADIAHPVGLVGVADKGCSGQDLFNVFIHAFQVIGVGKIRFVDCGGDCVQSHGQLVAVDGHGLGQVE